VTRSVSRAVPATNRRRGVVALLATMLLVADCAVSAADDLVSIGSGLSGPAGMQASVFASGATHVSAFAFDADGRLWLSTADYTDSGQDGVYLVPQAGADPIEIVGSLHTPLGLLWYQGALYVSSAAGIVAYSEFDGTRFGDVRTVVSFPAGVGEINGIAVGPDGRMVVGISAPCDACEPVSEDSAAIVSFLPDGTDLEVYASGIRAPVGLAFYPGSGELYATMNQRDDLGDLTPGDWLAVVAEGQTWGFPDCYGQQSSACDATPAPVAVLDTHAAVSGVAIVTGQLGPAVGTSALVAEWAKGTVQRVALAADDSSVARTVTTFLRGLTNPVPVTVAPDGTLFVGDWGTGVVYRISAP
jgi:glucose/arabinose dehydrogenase